MRLLTCGVDAEGRSCVVSEREIDFSPGFGKAGTSVAKLFETDQSPPPPCPPGQSHFNGGKLGPGVVRSYAIDHAPHDGPRDHLNYALHYADKIDLVVVLEGEGDMMLADGPHPMKAGDCIVMPASDHAMRPAPGGCRLIAFSIGTQPAA